MKCKIVTLLAFVLLFSKLFGQNPNSIFKYDTTFYGKTTFTVFANRTFGQLATGQNTANLANFGSFDPTKGSFDFNAFTPLTFRKKESDNMVPYLSLEMKGDLAGDNVTTLFSNSKLNTNIDGTIKLHFPLPSLNSISFLGSEFNKLADKKLRLQQEYDIRLDEADTTLIKARRRSDELKWQLAEKRSMSKKDNDTLIMYNDSIAKFKSRLTAGDTAKIIAYRAAFEKVVSRLYTLRRDSLKLYNELRTVDTLLALNPSRRFNHILKVKKQLKTEFRDSLQKLELAAPLAAVRIAWITAKANFNKKRYYTYDSTSTIPYFERLGKTEKTFFNYGFEFHFYQQSALRGIAHYFNIGYSWGQNNNIKELSTSEYAQKEKSAQSGVEREVVKKYSVYTDSITEFRSRMLYANYYFMFKRSALSAVHIFPEYDRRNNGDKVWNTGIGYVISLKDSKKEKAVLNAEAYYKFLDLGNDLDSDKNFFERNEIGIRIGLPLNFVINNN